MDFNKSEDEIIRCDNTGEAKEHICLSPSELLELTYNESKINY
jgi:hypothetical protein